MKDCICCGAEFEAPTGEDVYPPSYEYCGLCLKFGCHLTALPVGPIESEES